MLLFSIISNKNKVDIYGTELLKALYAMSLEAGLHELVANYLEH